MPSALEFLSAAAARFSRVTPSASALGGLTFLGVSAMGGLPLGDVSEEVVVFLPLDPFGIGGGGMFSD